MNATTVVFSDARGKLLDSAEHLFAEQGYELTSIRQIASAAALNMSLINYYFGSKQALYQEVFKTRLEEMNLNLRAIAENKLSAAQKLNQFLTIYAEGYRSNTKFQRLLFREVLFLAQSRIQEVIENYLSENRKMFTEIITAGIASGDFCPLNTSLVYMTMISAMTMAINESAADSQLAGRTASIAEVKSYLQQLILTKNNVLDLMN
jgi:AcrR family transcriptional regulator